VAQADIEPGALVLDIGAGTGAITHHLIRARARVVAIELHPKRAAALRQRYPQAGIRVVEADATDLRLPRHPFAVVANPPFAATTAILRRLLHPASRLDRADLIVPLPVAVRWLEGRDPDRGRWMERFDGQLSARVPQTAFRPQPPKPAAVLTFTRRPSR
jgi:23S rRNA (adenine-N6)-dimethyltransferase